MKIAACRSIGLHQTYSPEMSGSQHNYVTSHSSAIHRNSHAVSYCLMAIRCLWLKAHFAPEFWAAVMSGCHPQKLVRYMGVARAEAWKPTDITYCGKSTGNHSSGGGVQFSVVNINNMTSSFTVTGDVVNQGLIGIKGIGENAAKVFEGRGNFTSIDEFVEKYGKSKTVIERLIKLGSFSLLPGHENSKAVWTWYQYKYCSGKDITILRKKIREDLLAAENWNQKAIEAERSRQATVFKSTYPKRQIPQQIKNWTPKPCDSRAKVMALITEDFKIEERLEFQKKYLGFWIDSPMAAYRSHGILLETAKESGKHGGEVLIEGIVTDVLAATTKTNKEYLKLFITDGVQQALIFIWPRELAMQDLNRLKVGSAVSMYVEYDDTRKTFSLARGETIIPLLPR